MAPRSTRSKPAPPASSPEPTKPQLLRNENEQRRMFILPRDISSEAQIVTLPHPATSTRSRYLICPIKGLYEFSRIAAPRGNLRSWLIAGNANTELPSTSEVQSLDLVPADRKESDNPLRTGYVLENADLFIATPSDPLFFLSPLFQPLSIGSQGAFRLGDDYVDTLSEASKELAIFLRKQPLQRLFLARLKCVSETQELGDDILYKPCLQLFINELERKAIQMASDETWPPSLEEAFVRRQLEIPISLISHENTQLPTPEQSMTESNTESGESQLNEGAESNVNNHNSGSQQHSNVSMEEPNPVVSNEVKKLMRIRVASNYILSSYLPASLRDRCKHLLSSSRSLDFTPLDAHLGEVQKAKDEIQALRSVSDNFSRKRSNLDDEEAIEARAEKKRRKEEEEKKKKAESRATKELKKVNTSGMKKLSSFFSKSTTAK